MKKPAGPSAGPSATPMTVEEKSAVLNQLEPGDLVDVEYRGYGNLYSKVVVRDRSNKGVGVFARKLPDPLTAEDPQLISIRLLEKAAEAIPRESGNPRLRPYDLLKIRGGVQKVMLTGAAHGLIYVHLRADGDAFMTANVNSFERVEPS